MGVWPERLVSGCVARKTVEQVRGHQGGMHVHAC